MGDLDHAVNRLLLEEIGRREAVERITAARLRFDWDKRIYAPLFDRAVRFWQHLARVVKGWEIADDDDSFVLAWLRGPIERRVLAAAQRGKAVA